MNGIGVNLRVDLKLDAVETLSDFNVNHTNGEQRPRRIEPNPLLVGIPAEKPTRVRGLCDMPVEIVDKIIGTMFETDVSNLMKASDKVAHRMTPNALQDVAVWTCLRRIRSLSDFRELLYSIAPAERRGAAKPLTAAAVAKSRTCEKIPAEIEGAVLARLGGRILGLPKDEQKIALADLSSVLAKRTIPSLPNSSAYATSIYQLETTEAQILKTTSRQCGSCVSAHDVHDLAIRLGVSSPAGIAALKLQAAKARIATRKNVQSVADQFEISDQTQRKALEHYLVYETSIVHKALEDAIPDWVVMEFGITAYESDVHRLHGRRAPMGRRNNGQRHRAVTQNKGGR